MTMALGTHGTLPTVRRPSRWRSLLLSSPLATAGVIIIALLIVATAAAPLLTHLSPTRATGGINEFPSAAHLLGTTGQGQDVLSEFLYGGRISLAVGLSIAVLTTLIALAVAALDGGLFPAALSTTR